VEREVQGASMDFRCWASNAARPKDKKGEVGKEEGLPILERDQTNEIQI
jgi:hypothetical protein